jgi:hypothetical protein
MGTGRETDFAVERLGRHDVRRRFARHHRSARFSVLNVSFNLLSPGLMHPHPVALISGSLLPVGATAKGRMGFSRGRRARDIYLWICLTISITDVLVWVSAYAPFIPFFQKHQRAHQLVERLRSWDWCCADWHERNGCEMDRRYHGCRPSRRRDFLVGVWECI